jgi:hypothetical protein
LVDPDQVRRAIVDPEPPRPVRVRANGPPAIEELDLIDPPSYFRALAGVEVADGGMIPCPLPDHEDSHASCQVFEEAARGWWCYGCAPAAAASTTWRASWRAAHGAGRLGTTRLSEPANGSVRRCQGDSPASSSPRATTPGRCCRRATPLRRLREAQGLAVPLLLFAQISTQQSTEPTAAARPRHQSDRGPLAIAGAGKRVSCLPRLASL